MTSRYGRAKSLEDITCDDAMRDPVWVWALDELEGDETWQKPVIGTTDVDRALLRRHLTAIITLRAVSRPELVLSGEFDGTAVAALALWSAGRWRMLPEVADLEYPLEVEAVPTIFGIPNARFRLHAPEEDRAMRVHDDDLAPEGRSTSG